MSKAARRVSNLQVAATTLPPRLPQVGNAVCELAESAGAAGWPELLPFLFQAVQAAPERLREGALLIFARLAGEVAPQLAAHVATLRSGALSHPSAYCRRPLTRRNHIHPLRSAADLPCAGCGAARAPCGHARSRRPCVSAGRAAVQKGAGGAD